ncbi:hypothetical protein NDA01_21585 [Trichocoleus desertorum AS-A10]|uniref:hypothetical protein n=1 Tax=Trichocoleus desertorum TaxID=1481672 RepID=UPI003299D9E4
MNSASLANYVQVSKLIDEIGVGKTTFYTRWLPDLRIKKPLKFRGRSYVSDSEARLVREFAAVHPQGEQAIAAFLKRLHEQGEQSERSEQGAIALTSDMGVIEQGEQPTQLLEPPAWLLPLMQMLSDRFQQDPLANLRSLQEVSEAGWELPTSKLASLLELHPKSLGGMRTYRKFGFTCTKLSRQGREAAWKVERV